VWGGGGVVGGGGCIWGGGGVLGIKELLQSNQGGSWKIPDLLAITLYRSNQNRRGGI